MAKNNEIADRYRAIGNKFLEEGDSYEAFLHYNRSLCFAESGTETAAYAYGNRSAVLFEMRAYELCIENIELAKASKYPQDKMEKLDQRKADAQRLLVEKPEKDPEKELVEYFKMSFPSNPKHPSLADCLELREDEQNGKHIITTRDLKPKDVVALIRV